MLKNLISTARLNRKSPGSGDKITLVRFGSFSVRERAQCKGRNPRTGEKIKIPAKKVVKFKAGKSLAEEGILHSRAGKRDWAGSDDCD